MQAELRYAILSDDHEIIPVYDVMAWAKWKEENVRKWIIARDSIGGGVWVSTVFLGLNHSFLKNGRPLWFETMIFNGPHDGYQERCSTYQEALEEHKTALEIARKD